MAQPLVVVTEHLDDAALEWLGQKCRVERCASSDPGFPALLSKADGLVIRTYTKVDKAFLEKGTRLKVIGRAGVGLDNVDLAACAAKGVAVVHTPDANSRSVVEYVVALLLDATRPRAFVDQVIDPERWKEARQELKARRQLCELTLGILGMGRVGSGVARVAAALEMKVIYHDLIEIPREKRFGAEPVSKADLFAKADAISVHVDGRKSNRNLLSAADFARCKADLIFVNTSRGFVVDNHALAEFMIAHPGALALLDVHEPEPFDATYPLLEIDNVHLAPHIASATDLAHANMSWVVKDVWRVLSGEKPEFPAKPEPE